MIGADEPAILFRNILPAVNIGGKPASAASAGPAELCVGVDLLVDAVVDSNRQ
jgi:hypothetical protein